MLIHEQTILLVSDDASLCAAARREFGGELGLRVAAVSNVEAARRILEDATPAVILLEEAPLAVAAGESDRETAPLAAAVSSLARYAPVVVIGEAAQQKEMTALIAAGAADFVPRTEKCLSTALGLVGRRLDFASAKSVPGVGAVACANAPADEAFGEILRHELNNPLTGILGNAELLLAEIRRKNDDQVPSNAQQRLETIAALAVRLRETVRRLSQDWESHQNTAS